MHDQEYAKRFYRNDPLLVLLIDKWNINQTGLTFGVSILWLVITAIPWLAGAATFHIDSLGIDLTEALLIFPIGIALYFGIPRFLGKFFAELAPYAGESRKLPTETYDEFVSRLIMISNNYAWVISAIFIVVLYWLYRLFGNLTADFTRDLPEPVRSIYRILMLLVYTPLLYSAGLSIFRIVIGVFFTGKFFNTFRIRVNPLSPDGAGGIGIVGQALAIGVLFITFLGVVSTAMIYLSLALGVNPFERAETIALGLLYIILIPFVFWNWLWAPHLALLDAREQALTPMVEEFKNAATEKTSLNGESTEAIRAKTDRLIEIKKQYDLIRDTFPVWPLEVQPLRNLLATSVLPAVSSLLSGPILELWKVITTFIK